MEEKHIIFIPKDQFHMEPVTPISTWPTETAEGESETQKVFRHKATFSFKIPKKERKILLKKLRIITKLPRKLKKGGRHLEYSEIGDFSIETKDGEVICKSPLMHIRIKKGYPHTKWAKKALRLINRSVFNNLRKEI